ncbi:MAG: DUF983 domain-containing protein [Pyrinomonadaceae bacterium]
MKKDRTLLGNIVRWCLRLRCPACGKSSIARAPFRIADSCPSCGVVFKREEGFFVGAILINVVATEAAILFVYLVSIQVTDGYQTILAVLFVVALVFPVAFYHHSWSIWLSLDHWIEKLPTS